MDGRSRRSAQCCNPEAILLNHPSMAVTNKFSSNPGHLGHLGLAVNGNKRNQRLDSLDRLRWLGGWLGKRTPLYEPHSHLSISHGGKATPVSDIVGGSEVAKGGFSMTIWV